MKYKLFSISLAILTAARMCLADSTIAIRFGWSLWPVKLVILEKESRAAIAGARIRIYTIDGQATRVVNAVTDVNGERSLFLDTAQYQLVVTHNNYVQKVDTLSVAALDLQTDTIYLSPFDPGIPPQVNLCRVYGWVYDVSGGKLAGAQITAEIPGRYHPVKYEGATITPFSRECKSDSSGYWYIDLLPSALLTTGQVGTFGESKYLFTIKYSSGIVYRVETTVPVLPSWRLP